MTEADAAPIYVDDVESAAERFCSDHDSDGDYGIIRSGKATLKARRAGQTFTVEIEAETVPEYRASVAAEPDPETTAEEEPS